MTKPEPKSSTPILDRDDDNRKRKQRLDRMKRGPGVFIYEGGAHDTEWTPTILLTSRNVAELDSNGMPLLDGSGRQVFKRAGTPVTDSNGAPLLGGPPKIVHHPVKVRVVRGTEFPIGKPVRCDAALALKIRCLPHFLEVDDEASAEAPSDEPVKRGRGRPRKSIDEADAETSTDE